ncbi:MAG: hypothetical protein C4540_03670 [Candidatus Omnitrophota bacterium]|jgi:rubrerythrin|nr:MAG: hypothetical protein C4540_03670 [Candidatus Omnitrophota bacterium]
MRIEEKGGALVIVDFNDFEAYKIACKIERDGIAFYGKLLAKQGSNSVAAGSLRFLLKEEQRHLSLFENSLSALRQKKEDITEDEDLLGSLDYGIFQFYQSPEELDALANNFLKALKIGVAIEDSSIKFYNACKVQLKGKDVQEAVALVIEEEKRHKQALEDILSNL